MKPDEVSNVSVVDTNTYTSFAELYDANIDELYRYVHRRCRDHVLAEDITQDTFLTAVRKHHPSEISAGWLKRVARNRLIDVLQRTANYESKLQLVGVKSKASDEAIIAERLQVEAAFDELSVDHRPVLTLHYIDDLTIPKMAEALGRSQKSIEGLVTRARRQLRAELGGSDV